MFLLPIGRALGQLDDRVFIGVVLNSVLWSLACFAGLAAGSFWLLQQMLSDNGVAAWIAGLAGAFAAALLALWLFLPASAAIGMMYFDRIAIAVERRYYPWMPPPAGEAMSIQLWDGLVVTLKVLALNIVALLLTLSLGAVGIGFVLGWAVGAYAIGRGLFVAVAMRRMPRPAAEATYHANRFAVLAQGAVLALAAYIPLLNLLLPVIGVAAMVHLLDMTMSSPPTNRPFRGNYGAY